MIENNPIKEVYFLSKFVLYTDILLPTAYRHIQLQSTATNTTINMPMLSETTMNNNDNINTDDSINSSSNNNGNNNIQQKWAKRKVDWESEKFRIEKILESMKISRLRFCRKILDLYFRTAYEQEEESLHSKLLKKYHVASKEERDQNIEREKYMSKKELAKEAVQWEIITGNCFICVL